MPCILATQTKQQAQHKSKKPSGKRVQDHYGYRDECVPTPRDIDKSCPANINLDM